MQTVLESPLPPSPPRLPPLDPGSWRDWALRGYASAHRHFDSLNRAPASAPHRGEAGPGVGGGGAPPPGPAATGGDGGGGGDDDDDGGAAAEGAAAEGAAGEGAAGDGVADDEAAGEGGLDWPVFVMNLASRPDKRRHMVVPVPPHPIARVMVADLWWLIYGC